MNKPLGSCKKELLGIESDSKAAAQEIQVAVATKYTSMTSLQSAT